MYNELIFSIIQLQWKFQLISVNVLYIKDWKKRESLAALMQDPRSPEFKHARGQGQQYAELVHYSIVIDVKSTVWGGKGGEGEGVEYAEVWNVNRF